MWLHIYVFSKGLIVSPPSLFTIPPNLLKSWSPKIWMLELSYHWNLTAIWAALHLKNAYGLGNLGALISLLLNKITHSSMYGCEIFCVEFQRVPLKFHTKYLTHTLKDIFSYNVKIQELSDLRARRLFEMPPLDHPSLMHAGPAPHSLIHCGPVITQLTHWLLGDRAPKN